MYVVNNTGFKPYNLKTDKLITDIQSTSFESCSEKSDPLNVQSLNMTLTLNSCNMNPGSLSFNIDSKKSNINTFTDKKEEVFNALKSSFLNQIYELASNCPDKFKSILNQSFGSKIDNNKLNELVNMALNRQFPLPENLEFVGSDTLGESLGAYSPQNGGTVFINSDSIENADQILQIFTEEVGHHIDSNLFQDDSPLDEGKIFAFGVGKGSNLSDDEMDTLAVSSDSKTIEFNGEKIKVETAVPLVAAGIWLGKVAGATAVDAVLDIAIAAVTGSPPPGFWGHAGNAVLNAIPFAGEANKLKKVVKLGKAVDKIIDSIKIINKLPNGNKIISGIISLKNDFISAIKSADLDKAKTLLSQFLSEAGEAQKLAKAMDSGLAKLGGSRLANFTEKQLQKKYKHADVFELPKNFNPQNSKAFEEALKKHINSDDSLMIDGVYTRGSEVLNVIHYYDPVKKINVIVDKKTGDFVSAWKLSEKQREHLLTTGKLGGG